MERGKYLGQIEDIIGDLIDRHGHAKRTLVLHTFLSSLPPASCDFDTLARSDTAGNLTREILRRYKVGGADDPAPTLFGYEHLQMRYLVSRDREQTVVSVHECTDDELRAKQQELGSMVQGLRAHSNEIDEFISQRNQT